MSIPVGVDSLQQPQVTNMVISYTWGESETRAKRLADQEAGIKAAEACSSHDHPRPRAPRGTREEVGLGALYPHCSWTLSIQLHSAASCQDKTKKAG